MNNEGKEIKELLLQKKNYWKPSFSKCNLLVMQFSNNVADEEIEKHMH